MRNGDWFCLAVRLFGIWLLIHSVEEFVPYLVWIVTEGSGLVAGLWLGAWFVGRTVVGLGLLLFAPAIAARFYPPAAAAPPPSSTDEQKPLKVGVQLLGMYALLLATQSAAGVIASYLQANSFAGIQQTAFFESGTSYMAALLTCGLNVAFALMLIIFNDRIVTFLAKLRYVPERDAYEAPPLPEPAEARQRDAAGDDSDGVR